MERIIKNSGIGFVEGASFSSSGTRQLFSILRIISKKLD
jgi:hypothetical protein